MTMDVNFIDFKCPYCTEAVSFSTDTAGKMQECPECAETLIVPQESSEFGHRIPIPTTTPRLILRRLAGGDWKDLLEFMSDDELFRYPEGSPLGEEQVIQWLERDKAVKLTTPDTRFCLAIQVQAGGKVIGYVALNFIDSLRQQATFDVDTVWLAMLSEEYAKSRSSPPLRSPA